MDSLKQLIEKKAKAEGKIVCDCIEAFLSIIKQANGEHAIGEPEFVAWNERRNVQWVKVSDVKGLLPNYVLLDEKQLKDFDIIKWLKENKFSCSSYPIKWFIESVLLGGAMERK